MASNGGGSEGGDKRALGRGSEKDSNIAELLQKLNLTTEEGEVADFSDDEEAVVAGKVEWALLGKVLSPVLLHASTIRSATAPDGVTLPV
jgi:hypothetical protein